MQVEYLLHVQNSLADHKSGLLQSKASMEQKNENIRSRFLCQRDALLQTRYELKQTKKVCLYCAISDDSLLVDYAQVSILMTP